VIRSLPNSSAFRTELRKKESRALALNRGGW
jgi:hypothetical protein